nr:putative late blight resistance protein homolog R1B-23 [Ipomoea batatas]
MNPNNHIGRLENLKKLVFCDITFRWKAVNSLSKLPKLEVLKLLRCFCIGEEEWKLSKKEKFEQLVYLKIDAIDLKCWEASAYQFPNLECLILSWCEKLEEIPANFAEISNLKSIKLIRCLPSAVASAKQIWEEQHDQGNEDMIVIEEYTRQILEFGGLEDEEVFLFPEDLAVGDDYYPEVIAKTTLEEIRQRFPSGIIFNNPGVPITADAFGNISTMVEVKIKVGDMVEAANEVESKSSDVVGSRWFWRLSRFDSRFDSLFFFFVQSWPTTVVVGGDGVENQKGEG